MPHGRAATAALLVELLGDAARLLDLDEGWPVLISVTLPTGGTARLAVFVGPVHSMARYAGEVRFQNPGTGRPVLANAEELPLLVGLDVGPPPVLVVPETARRVGRETRFSVRFPDTLVAEARATGWATPHISTSGEVFHAFHPTLLPVYLDTVAAGVEITPELIAEGISASDVLQDDTPANRERARRFVSATVRDALFSPTVLSAYGYRCAMCGLGLGLVVAAHILPVAAPDSPDEVTNGLALCPNHHKAFDDHLIYVEPTDYALVLHPLLEAASTSADDNFVQTTAGSLAAPAEPRQRPSAGMFEARYAFFDGAYDWV
jgi:hypothetical protein